jgi:preprotein translocase subunit SecG
MRGEACWLTRLQMFETVVFFVSVLIVNYLIADGRRYVWNLFLKLVLC